MFCYQCQETARNAACTVKGVCGKREITSNLQDLLIFVLRGIAHFAEKDENIDRETGVFLCKTLFSTITNANFDDEKIKELITEGLKIRDDLKSKHSAEESAPDCVTWTGDENEFGKKAEEVGILSLSPDENKRSLKSIILYGLKGIAAYAEHAAVLENYDDDVFRFVFRALSLLDSDAGENELFEMVVKTGETAVKAMAVLDAANTSAYGNPEKTYVKIGVGDKPGILISGHDLRDMEELLLQTQGTGVDVYTHGEMLPANYYPVFKKFPHLRGNYGGSWWKQDKEFESFNGPILMTTNCITPVKDSYRERIFTTGMAGYPGVKHIKERTKGGKKNFTEIIELAKKCLPPREIEKGEIVGGFAHGQVEDLAGKIVEEIKSGAIKKFVVMAGCDGRYPSRNYYTEVAELLPKDTVILTAGCAKYRYNKLNLGDINGIPRVLDAGQCNDSYSLALTALKLKEAFGLQDVNDLPLAFDIAWYEQKAVAVLLALLFLGFKNIILGPTLPAFVSPDAVKLLVDKFGLRGIEDPQKDVNLITGGNQS
ncbi:hydroxylamine reductase [candidate division WOR-3 bacterium]|nr:hydroxylamine reductase [candidate division WOR-3 bacterium]